MTSNANNPAKITNIYNADGTLTSNRGVNLGANNLAVNGTGTVTFNNNTVSLSSVPTFNIDSAGIVGGRVRVLTNGNLGIGQPNPNAPLQFGNTTVNRKVVLFESANNDHQFYGLGINSNILRYQVAATANDHVFYAGTSTTTSNELARLTGTGNLGLGITPQAKLHANGNGLFQNAPSLNPLATPSPDVSTSFNFAQVQVLNGNARAGFGVATTAADGRDRMYLKGAKDWQYNLDLVIPNGNLGLATSAPINTLHIGAPAIANTTGIRTSITSASPSSAETSYLAVNAAGDIVKGAAINSGKISWFDLSGILNFGASNGTVSEYTVQVTGTGQVQLRLNYGTYPFIVKTYQIFQTNAAALVTSSKDVSLANATTFSDLSFNSAGVAIAISNNTVYECTIAALSGNRYHLRITSFGGGYSIAAQLIN